MRVLCAPSASMPPLEKGYVPFLLYDRSPSKTLGSAGSNILRSLTQAGLVPALRAWDFLSIALGVIAADESCPRRTSSDGWTRELDLTISVSDQAFWQPQAHLLERILCFLTGDIWRLSFLSGGLTPPTNQRRPQQADSICLLSGGIDSLVGALDLTALGRQPMLTSQIAKGDKNTQRSFAKSIAGGLPHLQMNHLVKPPGPSERSQRARSIIFMAYGILAATALDRYMDGDTVQLFVPENGFISLNIPLTTLRLGTLSTRTTHPIYMKNLQLLLDKAELRVQVINPYQFKTKGEMLAECQDQAFLHAHAVQATSCGRFPRTGFQHCGRCVPCLIRRSAFHRWGVQDQTSYRYADLSIQDQRHREFDDVRAALMAIEQVRLLGVESWAAGAINSAQLGETAPFLAIADRGVNELAVFLESAGAM